MDVADAERRLGDAQQPPREEAGHGKTRHPLAEDGARPGLGVQQRVAFPGFFNFTTSSAL